MQPTETPAAIRTKWAEVIFTHIGFILIGLMIGLAL